MRVLLQALRFHLESVILPALNCTTYKRSISLRSVSNKMGFPCTYLQAVVFSPVTHGGIGSIDLRIEQSIMIITVK